jgi:hypothetical protein
VPLLPEIKPHTPDSSNHHRCTICGGEGPTLPTGCPGRFMTDEEREGVRSGKLNFFNGKFVAFD